MSKKPASTSDANAMPPDVRYEKLDYTPVQLPFGHKKPESLQDQIRRLIRSERFAEEVRSMKKGTFEEEDDFEDDAEGAQPMSPHELRDLDGQPEHPAVQAEIDRRRKGKKKAAEATPKPAPSSQPAPKDDAAGKNVDPDDEQ